MSKLDPVNVLRSFGDLLERAIVGEAIGHLDPILQPYAKVWLDHVVARRIPGDSSRIQPEWMRFAGSHYTVLIRIYNAWKHLSGLRDACVDEADSMDATLLLQIQDFTASFWWNIGSAIDNFAHCLAEFPFEQYKAMGKEYFCADERFKDFIYFYDRRTQFIHNRLVPVGIDQGMVVFNFHHLDSEDGEAGNVPKFTDWDQPLKRKELIVDFYERKWDVLLKALSGAWLHMSHLLLQVDVNRPKFTVREEVAQESNVAASLTAPSFITQAGLGMIRMTAISGVPSQPTQLEYGTRMTGNKNPTF